MFGLFYVESVVSVTANWVIACLSGELMMLICPILMEKCTESGDTAINQSADRPLRLQLAACHAAAYE